MSKPYSLQLAERIHNTTGQEYLPKICFGGLFLESFWNLVIERRVLGTPKPVVQKYMHHTLTRWPIIYFATRIGLSWAAWRVNQAGIAERENDQQDS